MLVDGSAGVSLVMARTQLLQEQLTRSVIGAFFSVYNSLGYGFLEHLYVTALERELKRRGHRTTRELSVRVMYHGEQLGSQRLDLVVDELLIVEIKSTADLPPIAKRQLLNYLRATNLEVGLLLHFGPKPKFHRLVYENALKPRARDP